MNLTIFDLDNTLLAGDSDYEWGQFLVKKGIVDAEQYTKKNNQFYEDYKNKTLNIYKYQEFVLTPLIPMNALQRSELHAEFMTSVVGNLRLSKADDLIQKHIQQGDTLLIITATNQFIAGPIGPWLGIDSILATEPEIINDRFTGKIIGTPCFQDGKILRLQQWLQEQKLNPATITFYSDSINDLPLLEYADIAIAVDPDTRLKAAAEVAGWPIMSLR